MDLEVKKKKEAKPAAARLCSTIKLRFTAVSVPIEIVQNNNLNFFPDRFGNSNKLMTNKEFNALLSKLLTHKDVYKIFDSSELAVSGKTFVTRNCEELFLPESYSPIRETSKNSNLSISINHLTKPLQKNQFDGIKKLFHIGCP